MTVQAQLPDFDEDYFWAELHVSKYTTIEREITISLNHSVICVRYKPLRLDNVAKESWRIPNVPEVAKPGNDLYIVPSWWSFARNGNEPLRSSDYSAICDNGEYKFVKSTYFNFNTIRPNRTSISHRPSGGTGTYIHGVPGGIHPATNHYYKSRRTTVIKP